MEKFGREGVGGEQSEATIVAGEGKGALEIQGGKPEIHGEVRNGSEGDIKSVGKGLIEGNLESGEVARVMEGG